MKKYNTGEIATWFGAIGLFVVVSMMMMACLTGCTAASEVGGAIAGVSETIAENEATIEAVAGNVETYSKLADPFTAGWAGIIGSLIAIAASTLVTVNKSIRNSGLMRVIKEANVSLNSPPIASQVSSPSTKVLVEKLKLGGLVPPKTS